MSSKLIIIMKISIFFFLIIILIQPIPIFGKDCDSFNNILRSAIEHSEVKRLAPPPETLRLTDQRKYREALPTASRQTKLEDIIRSSTKESDTTIMVSTTNADGEILIKGVRDARITTINGEQHLVGKTPGATATDVSIRIDKIDNIHVLTGPQSPQRIRAKEAISFRDPNGREARAFFTDATKGGSTPNQALSEFRKLDEAQQVDILADISRKVQSGQDLTPNEYIVNFVVDGNRTTGRGVDYLPHRIDLDNAYNLAKSGNIEDARKTIIESPMNQIMKDRALAALHLTPNSPVPHSRALVVQGNTLPVPHTRTTGITVETKGTAVEPYVHTGEVLDPIKRPPPREVGHDPIIIEGEAVVISGRSLPAPPTSPSRGGTLTLTQGTTKVTPPIGGANASTRAPTAASTTGNHIGRTVLGGSLALLAVDAHAPTAKSDPNVIKETNEPEIPSPRETTTETTTETIIGAESPTEAPTPTTTEAPTEAPTATEAPTPTPTATEAPTPTPTPTATKTPIGITIEIEEITKNKDAKNIFEREYKASLKIPEGAHLPASCPKPPSYIWTCKESADKESGPCRDAKGEKAKFKTFGEHDYPVEVTLENCDEIKGDVTVRNQNCGLGVPCEKAPQELELEDEDDDEFFAPYIGPNKIPPARFQPIMLPPPGVYIIPGFN